MKEHGKDYTLNMLGALESQFNTRISPKVLPRIIFPSFNIVTQCRRRTRRLFLLAQTQMYLLQARGDGASEIQMRGRENKTSRDNLDDLNQIYFKIQPMVG